MIVFSHVCAHIVFLRPPVAIATSNCYTQAVSKIPNLGPGQITEIYLFVTTWPVVTAVGYWALTYDVGRDVMELALMSIILT